MTTSRQWRLAARPVGKIRKSDFELRSIEDTMRTDIGAYPGMLERLFTGENTGKLVLELQR